MLPKPLDEALAGGSAAGVPLLAGYTRDEMSVLVDVLGFSLEWCAEMLRTGLPPALSAQTMIATYRAAREARGARTDAASIVAAILTDKVQAVPTMRLLDAQRAHAPVYCFMFDWIAPRGDGRLGAHHGMDVPFVFGTVDACSGMCGRGPAVSALSDAVMDAWTAFARTGDPGSPGLGRWPGYDSEQRRTMMIGPDVHVAKDPRRAERHAWDEVPASSPLLNMMF